MDPHEVARPTSGQTQRPDTSDTSTRAHIDTREFDPEGYISSVSWRLARTGDHEYTVRPTRKDHSLGSTADAGFEAMVTYVREHGYVGTWVGANGKKTRYTYLNVGSHRYWSMGAPLRITWILNRARLES